MDIKILQWLNDQGYNAHMGDDKFDIDKFRLEISKGGYRLEASLPKEDVSAPGELRKKIENMKATLDMLIEDDQEEAAHEIL